MSSLIVTGKFSLAYILYGKLGTQVVIATAKIVDIYYCSWVLPVVKISSRASYKTQDT